MFWNRPKFERSTPAAGPEEVAKGNINAMQNALRYRASVRFTNGAQQVFEDTGRNIKMDIIAAEVNAGVALEARIVATAPSTPSARKSDVIEMPGTDTIQ